MELILCVVVEPNVTNTKRPGRGEYGYEDETYSNLWPCTCNYFNVNKVESRVTNTKRPGRGAINKTACSSKKPDQYGNEGETF